MDKACVVCTSGKSKYRCPKCRGHYCSVACSGEHKLSCVAIKPESISTEKVAPTSSNSDVNNKSVSPKESKLTAQRPSDVVLLSDAQKKALAKDEEVAATLRSKRLQDKLRRIHAAPNRQDALKKARLIPEFDAFVGSILSAVTGPTTQTQKQK